MNRIKFLGAARNVTGSSYCIEANGTRLLVDCGLYQERKFRNRNWAPFPVEPLTIDAVLLTHTHLDHCGLLPKLVSEGFQGKIYCTSATSEITEIMLLDSAKIQEEDAVFKRRRHEREGRKGPFPEIPLYTISEAEAALGMLSKVKYGKPTDVANNIKATFFDAGHVFGSAMIVLSISADGEESRILFSGDVGRWDKPILEDPTVFDYADYVLIESTYGDRLHEDTSSIKSRLAEVVSSTLKAGGNIVVPSFSLERAQEFLYVLNELFFEKSIPRIKVFVDSPMAISITDVFKRHPELYDDEMSQLANDNMSPFKFEGLEMTRTVEQSKAINNIKSGALIIAGSGMCTGGRIKHHLVTNISRPESTILFIGYQAIGTLGRYIVEGAETVRILGQHHPVRANIAQIQGFSAHADRDELYKWISSLKEAPKQVFITHGESEVADSFKDFLYDKTKWDISVPEYCSEFTLD